MKITLATKNKGKIKEITGLLSGLGVEFKTLEDFPGLQMPEEDGSTFAENAVKKARYVAGITGTIALADDSGLVVDALGGGPGIFSARYAGPGATDKDNWMKLLKELEGVPFEKRKARFVCVIALSGGDMGEAVFEGTLEGRIAAGPSGSGGFGYDPVFMLSEENRTVAELSSEEKNRISHRAKALENTRLWLAEKARKSCK